MWRGSVPPWRMPSAAWRLDGPAAGGAAAAATAGRRLLLGAPGASGGSPPLPLRGLPRAPPRRALAGERSARAWTICIFSLVTWRGHLRGRRRSAGPGEAEPDLGMDSFRPSGRGRPRRCPDPPSRRRSAAQGLLGCGAEKEVPTSPGRPHTGPSARASERERGEGRGGSRVGPAGGQLGRPLTAQGLPRRSGTRRSARSAEIDHDLGVSLHSMQCSAVQCGAVRCRDRAPCGL